ncbi:MAG: YicC family protein [Gemmatimonadota bacterium]|nr:YicC family protein [Gemmatimonadota bacterium]MDH3428333.1 YicC family protein [Gemmatimonadota bacterium]
MTGFGAASVPVGSAEASLELRSVNSRHLKLNLRLPSGLEHAEGPLRELISSSVSRGNVDVTLRFDGVAAGESRIEVNAQRVEELLSAFRSIGERFGVAGEVDLALLARADRLFVERSEPLENLVDLEQLQVAAGQAVDQLIAMREQEGQRLADDLRARLATIRSRLTEVERRSPERLTRERDRLRAAVAELTERVEVDDDRVAREIAILADKWDLGEELVRARSHLLAFEELLAAPSSEAVGKRLGFLSQELQREINTIGSKANDSEIQHSVVEMKNELESMREQIENVE